MSLNIEKAYGNILLAEKFMKHLIKTLFSFAFIVLIAQMPQNSRETSYTEADYLSQATFKVQDACSSTCIMDYKKIAKCDSKIIIKDFLIEQILDK